VDAIAEIAAAAAAAVVVVDAATATRENSPWNFAPNRALLAEALKARFILRNDAAESGLATIWSGAMCPCDFSRSILPLMLP
jgi:hypothetical protein